MARSLRVRGRVGEGGQRGGYWEGWGRREWLMTTRVGCDEPVHDRVRYDKGLERSGGKSM